MNNELRWRVLTLQVTAIVVLAVVAGMAFWAHNYTHDQVGSQLSQQLITFPAANSPALKALPAADAAAMTQYAGQQLTTGYQADTYANHFIGVHLKAIGGGMTYSQISGKAIAEQKTNPKQFAIDEATALTLFRGETLRSLLLNAYAFWFVGDIALYAGFALASGAGVVFLTFLFEFAVVPRRQTATKKTSSPVVVA